MFKLFGLSTLTFFHTIWQRLSFRGIDSHEKGNIYGLWQVANRCNEMPAVDNTDAETSYVMFNAEDECCLCTVVCEGCVSVTLLQVARVVLRCKLYLITPTVRATSPPSAIRRLYLINLLLHENTLLGRAF